MTAQEWFDDRLSRIRSRVEGASITANFDPAHPKLVAVPTMFSNCRLYLIGFPVTESIHDMVGDGCLLVGCTIMTDAVPETRISIGHMPVKETA